jgi:hypothetical protein
MHKITKTLVVSIAPVLLSCTQQQPAPDVDPLLGRGCFAEKLPSLPPGSQYEGIQSATADRITIKVMNGTAVTPVDCGLASDGTLMNAGE